MTIRNMDKVEPYDSQKHVQGQTIQQSATDTRSKCMTIRNKHKVKPYENQKQIQGQSVWQSKTGTVQGQSVWQTCTVQGQSIMTTRNRYKVDMSNILLQKHVNIKSNCMQRHQRFQSDRITMIQSIRVTMEPCHLKQCISTRPHMQSLKW